MLILIGIVVFYLPVTACQCMEVLHEAKQCTPYVAAFATTESVLGCMDQCLAHNSNICSYLQWNVKTKDCILDTRSRPLSRIGDCITIRKMPCYQIYDSVCFEAAHGNVYEGNGEVTGLTQEEECKTLCMFMEKCRAYTWFARTSRCRIHRATRQSGRQLQTGDTQAKKLSECPTGRCTTLIAVAFATNGNKEESIRTIGMCMKESLNTTRVAKVDWNFDDNSCWSHRSRFDESDRYNDVKILQLLKHNHCKMTRRSMCMKKRKHVGMTGGYTIANVYEEDCVSLCYVVANCAAVELVGYGADCIFHHVKKGVKQMKHHTLYVAHECSTEATSMPTTSSATSTTTTQTTTVMPADDRRNAGIFRWSYYTRHTGRTAKAMRMSCLECALECQRVNCTGFSCDEHINGEGCDINVKNNPIFSGTLLHTKLLAFQERG